MNSLYFPDYENIFTSIVPLSHVNRADPATQEWSGDGNNTPCEDTIYTIQFTRQAMPSYF